MMRCMDPQATSIGCSFPDHLDGGNLILTPFLEYNEGDKLEGQSRTCSLFATWVSCTFCVGAVGLFHLILISGLNPTQKDAVEV